MALMGMMPQLEGATLSIWHSPPVAAPHRAVAGSSIRWLELRMARRAICGTIRPMNPMGPHHAVTIAVSTPDSSNIPLRHDLMFTPALSAYRVPSSRALSGFIYSMDRNTHSSVRAANTAGQQE